MHTHTHTHIYILKVVFCSDIMKNAILSCPELLVDRSLTKGSLSLGIIQNLTHKISNKCTIIVSIASNRYSKVDKSTVAIVI